MSLTVTTCTLYSIYHFLQMCNFYMFAYFVLRRAVLSLRFLFIIFKMGNISQQLCSHRPYKSVLQKKKHKILPEINSFIAESFWFFHACCVSLCIWQYFRATIADFFFLSFDLFLFFFSYYFLQKHRGKPSKYCFYFVRFRLVHGYSKIRYGLSVCIHSIQSVVIHIYNTYNIYYAIAILFYWRWLCVWKRLVCSDF